MKCKALLVYPYVANSTITTQVIAHVGRNFIPESPISKETLYDLGRFSWWPRHWDYSLQRVSLFWWFRVWLQQISWLLDLSKCHGIPFQTLTRSENRICLRIPFYQSGSSSPWTVGKHPYKISPTTSMTFLQKLRYQNKTAKAGFI